MSFRPFPATACWQHRGARAGFEVAYFQAREPGWRIDGTTTAIEDGQTWVVTYSIEADAAWATRHARIAATTVTGPREIRLESDGAGHWRLDGEPAPQLVAPEPAGGGDLVLLDMDVLVGSLRRVGQHQARRERPRLAAGVAEVGGVQPDLLGDLADDGLLEHFTAATNQRAV